MTSASTSNRSYLKTYYHGRTLELNFEAIVIIIFIRLISVIAIAVKISLNRNPVNRNFRKWFGCEALAPIQDNG